LFFKYPVPKCRPFLIIPIILAIICATFFYHIFSLQGKNLYF
jgi:hypothetical protein